MEVYLVRHGQSESNAGLTTNLDSNLTDLGRRQAQATAEALSESGISVAYVSPLIRTLQTIEPICRCLDIRATALPSVCEYFSERYPDFLKFDGLTSTEIVERFPFVRTSPEFPCEAPWWPSTFRTRRTAYNRAERVRDLLLAKFAETDTSVLIVSHSDPIGHLIEAFTRVEPDPIYPPWSDNCSITHFRVVDAAAPVEVILQNDTSHLTSIGVT